MCRRSSRGRVCRRGHGGVFGEVGMKVLVLMVEVNVDMVDEVNAALPGECGTCSVDECFGRFCLLLNNGRRLLAQKCRSTQSL